MTRSRPCRQVPLLSSKVFLFQFRVPLQVEIEVLRSDTKVNELERKVARLEAELRQVGVKAPWSSCRVSALLMPCGKLVVSELRDQELHGQGWAARD